MSYISEIKELLSACEVDSTIYQRKPVRVHGTIRPLTRRQRLEVEKLSIERGYRRFVADRMGNI
jgi:hypothetical protein